MKEGTVPVPPFHPSLSDNDVLPVRGVSYLGGRHSGRGKTPVERLACD